jgi:hypothetical protein
MREKSKKISLPKDFRSLRMRSRELGTKLWMSRTKRINLLGNTFKLNSIIIYSLNSSRLDNRGLVISHIDQWCHLWCLNNICHFSLLLQDLTQQCWLDKCLKNMIFKLFNNSWCNISHNRMEDFNILNEIYLNNACYILLILISVKTLISHLYH